MSNPRCPKCGHINIVGASMCDACEATLNRPFGEYSHTYDSSEGHMAHGGLSTDVPSPEFSRIGEVFSPTLAFYRKHFLFVGLLVLITSLPVVFSQYASMLVVGSGLTSTVPDNEVLEPAVAGLAFFGGVLSWVLALIGTSILEGALIYGVLDVLKTGSSKLGDCLRWGLKKLPRIFFANVLYATIIGLGFILLFVPGVILSLMFALVTPIIAIEGCGVMDAFTRSQSLTRGYKGLLFLTYFLWTFLIIAISFAISSSFAFGAGVWAFSGLFLQTLVDQMLQSSSIVLTVFIYLGIRNLKKQSFAAPVSVSYSGSAADR